MNVPDRRAGPNRRDASAAETRAALLAAGARLFAQRPYSELSGETIAAEAGATRGALQHHFASKHGLFAAVFELEQQRVATQVAAAVSGTTDPWEQARVGLAAFLEACADPAYRQIVLVAGPTALGWERWREQDLEYFGAMVDALIELLSGHGLAPHPPELLAATIRGALTEMSFEVAGASDPVAARTAALGVIETVVSAFRPGG